MDLRARDALPKVIELCKYSTTIPMSLELAIGVKTSFFKSQMVKKKLTKKTQDRQSVFSTEVRPVLTKVN